MLTLAALLLVTTPADTALARFLADGTGDRAALIAHLRARGPAGLDEVLRTIPVDAAGLPAVAAGDARGTRALDLADAVAGQRNAAYTGAFWFTSLDDALAEAKRTHKPVLSLRLLGRLDEELSCANSRYFRSLVYPDAKVRALLRDKFVLHWQTVRPAPKITIDMGDGRTLVGTVTGNSAHVILDGDGRVVDALPGLYDAQHFVTALEGSLALARLAQKDRAAAHRKRALAIAAEWQRVAPNVAMPELSADDVDALDVSVRAMTKALPERVVLSMLTERAAPELAPIYQKLGAAHSTSLSPGAAAIFKSQLAPGVIDELARARTLQAMAADSAQNEYVFHRQIHVWLANGAGSTSAEMQQRMYDELFATPARDPWLGLVGVDSYTGVTGGGVSGVGISGGVR